MRKSGLKDEVLIERALSGDQDAYTALYYRIQPLLYRIAKEFLRFYPEDQEDFIQNASTKILLRLASFKAEAKFSTWVTVIGKNEALMQIRARRQRHRDPNYITYIDAGEVYEENPVWEIPDPDDQYAALTAALDVYQILAEVPIKLRTIIECRFLHKMRYEEIAKEYGKPVATLKAQTRRGLLYARGVAETRPAIQFKSE